MSWDTDFYAAVVADSAFTAAVTTLAYEYKADGVAPFATYQLIGANGTDSLAGASSEGERLIQLSVWAANPTLAKTIAMDAIAGAKAGLTVTSIFERSRGRDADEELFGYLVDFTVFFSAP